MPGPRRLNGAPRIEVGIPARLVNHQPVHASPVETRAIPTRPQQRHYLLTHGLVGIFLPLPRGVSALDRWGFEVWCSTMVHRVDLKIACPLRDALTFRCSNPHCAECRDGLPFRRIVAVVMIGTGEALSGRRARLIAVQPFQNDSSAPRAS
jgi:hypothetical protein